MIFICHPFIAFEGVTFACTWLLTWTFPPKEKNQKRNNFNCGRMIAGLPKLHQVPAGCLAIRQQSALYRDHICLRYLKSEAWSPKSWDITWTSSSGESWRGWCVVKIQGIDNLKQRLRLCWAHISQHRVAKAIQAFTKRLKGCIARRGGRFELRPKSRFVGRSWNAQKKRQIPFDSWWCADSKNVIFIKIGRWPFWKIPLLCLTRHLFL